MSTGSAAPAERQARVLHVRGVVQGVGFRPFIRRLAEHHRLTGSVRNESGEVRIEIEGTPADVRAFLAELEPSAPPLARVDGLEVEPCAPRGHTDFAIVSSADVPDLRLPVSPDVAICPACEAELFDPANRRYRYPFITCTDCGPRFTVIDTMPYDRERTSMRAFVQCEACLREYTTATDRRCHSQTNSCPRCGPHVWLLTFVGEHCEPVHQKPLDVAADLLRAGKILAARGLGGFHLAVDATNERAVRRLRRRKRREAKPLAVMVRAVADARRLGAVGTEQERLLTSRERPVVLLAARADTGIAPSVAPGLDSIGVMTAYTPLHHLLLDLVGRPLVMTSGNTTDEPIAISNDDALKQLEGIADAFLMHNREILARYDDSVVRVVDKHPVFLRRARGYAPLPLEIPIATPKPLVAVGPHLKNTFAIAHDRTAYISQHIGDLENLETLEHFQSTLRAYRHLFRVTPTIAVRDRHPGYLSTRVAGELDVERIIDVQHHHAHIAAVAAEHGVIEPVVGVAYDGTGYGDDGHVWGAEILVADLQRYERVARLRYAPLPGGDLAVRLPWRVALGYLSLDPDAAPAFGASWEGVPPRERQIAERQIAQQLNTPLASSMGRLFDAAAAVLGVRTRVRYEGQAAMELEALAGTHPGEPLPFPVTRGNDNTWVMDPVPLLVALGERRLRGEDAHTLAAHFHESVAWTTTETVTAVCHDANIDTVALAGGVFQNARLLSSVRTRLEANDLDVLMPRQLSPNDGAISFGQIAVAAATLDREGGS